MLSVRTKGEPLLKTLTIRDFQGGYNVLDDDLNLASKFATKLYNCYYGADQTITVRYGTRLFVNLAEYTSTSNVSVVNVEYYNAALIAVMSNGEILRVYGDGQVERIWDSAKAAALPGAPTAWGATDFVSFEQFNGELIICNGVNKPLLIKTNFFVDFLKDLATGSNINTPICRYVTSADGFVVMAGDPVNPNRVHISARFASGTWYGDPAPNDGTYVDVGSNLRNASVIRGIRPFRDRLVVGFAEGTILGQLGIYNAAGTQHTPLFDDAVEQYGAISHRAMISYGDDMLMMDGVGVPSLKRTVFTGTIRPERVSDFVDREMSREMNKLTMVTQEERCFSVYNQREGMFMFFIPNSDSAADTTETKAYVYVYRPTLNVASWARFDGWNFTCGCRSSEGYMFFGDKDGKLWLYGSQDFPYSADFLNDDSVNEGEGQEIVFDWEMPWSDINKRMRTKTSKYIAMDVRGNGRYSVSLYADRFMSDGSGNDAPLLKMDFVGGDVVGFGGPSHPYGGGRSASTQKLYAWPAKFMWMKLRIRGSTKDPLKFVSINMLYQEGSFMR